MNVSQLFDVAIGPFCLCSFALTITISSFLSIPYICSVFLNIYLSKKKKATAAEFVLPLFNGQLLTAWKNTVTANEEEKLVASVVSLQVLPVPFSCFFLLMKRREGAKKMLNKKWCGSFYHYYFSFHTHKYVRANRCAPDIDASWRERVSFILIDYILPRDESGKTRERESLFLLLYFSLSRSFK